MEKGVITANTLAALLVAGGVTAQTRHDITRPAVLPSPAPLHGPTIGNQLNSPDYQWLDGLNRRVVDALDNSALWLDNQFHDGSETAGGAPLENHSGRRHQSVDAKARIIFGWEPKNGDLADLPVKFKIKLKLPSLEEKIDLIFSDNELQEFNQLPLESSRPEDIKVEDSQFSAAIRFIHQFKEDSYFTTRLGLGRSQLYTRTRYRWQTTLSPQWQLTIEPAVEYYMNDGAGVRLLSELAYSPQPWQQYRFSYNVWHREDLDAPEWKMGLYGMTSIDNKTSMINGLLLSSQSSPLDRDNKLTLNSRWRIRALREWLYFEVEPFVDFERRHDYDAKFGIALRVGGYFGYHD